MPGRDRGELLSTTNIEFLPGTNQVYAVAAGDTGTWIYKFEGLAKGAPLIPTNSDGPKHHLPSMAGSSHKPAALAKPAIGIVVERLQCVSVLAGRLLALLAGGVAWVAPST